VTPVRTGGPDVGLRLIIVYKLAKAAGEFLLAVLLAAVLVAGDTHRGRALAVALSGHVTGAWSLRLTELLARATAPRTVELTIVALLLDGVLTLCEGWVLYRRFIWAPWLVVIATGSLLPFEVFQLVRRPRAGRLLIFLANLSIVSYLAAQAARELRARRATP
jgi:uncharacterized membrane protein (DUF2068 family)